MMWLRKVAGNRAHGLVEIWRIYGTLENAILPVIQLALARVKAAVDVHE